MHLDYEKFSWLKTVIPVLNEPNFLDVIRRSSFVSMKDINSLMFPKQWELDYLQWSVFGKYAKVVS